MDGWVKQWQEAVDQGASCKVQDNSQVSPPNIDLFEVGQSTIQQNPNVDVCGYYFLPNQHSGDVASTIKELQLVGVNVYKLNAAVTVPGVHRFGNFDINAVQGGPSPALTETMTLRGDAVHPDEPGQQALDPGSPRREPVPAVQLLLRPGDLVVPAPARARRRRLPHAAAARGSVAVADRGSRPGHCARDAAGGVRLQHRLDGRARDGQPSCSARARPSHAARPPSTRGACTSPPAPRSSTARRSA